MHGPYAPPGKGCFPSDPRTRHLPGVGAATCACQPETIDVETPYATAGDDGAHTLAKIDEVINTTNYLRVVPSSVIGVEHVRAASLELVVFRNRVLLYYERKGLELPNLAPLAMPDGNAVPESLESHLVSTEETPQDSFVGGTVVRL